MGGWDQEGSGGGTDADAIHDNVAGEIAAVTEKASPVSADLLLIEDSADANAKKRVQVGNLPGGSGGGTVAKQSFATLTTTTAVSGTDTQWGSEEAVVDNALFAGTVDVVARLTGRSVNPTGTVNLRWFVRVEISIDGGATWDAGLAHGAGRFHALGEYVPVPAQHARAGVTPTGQIQARAMILGVSDSGPRFEAAILTLDVTDA